MRVLVRVLAVALVFAFAGCQSTQTSETSAGAGQPINANCAMRDSQAIDAACTIDYEGKTIGFCCNNCKRKFEGLTDAEKEERIRNLLR